MASPYVLSYTGVDSFGVKASFPPVYYMPTTPAAITVAEIGVDWLAIGDELEALTKAQITGGRVELPMGADAGWKSTPDAGANVGLIANFNFFNASNRYRQAVIIPAYVDALVAAGKVDLTTAAALIALLETAGLTNGYASTEEGAALTTLADAFFGERKHRRQLRNKTYTQG
jgi:hypothetical protein